MLSQPLDYYTLEHYLKIEDTLDYRTEFHDGVILPVEDATPTHAILGSRMGTLLNRAFPLCAVYDSSLNVYITTKNKVLHPDATVVCGPPNYPKQNCIDNPLIVVEVTSPSTKDYDNGTKRDYYFSLSSVQHYLLVSQTERKVGHYERSGMHWIYMDHLPADVSATERIMIKDVAIKISEIYTGILPYNFT